MIKDILAMAVVGVVMTVAVPICFAAAVIWQLWEITSENKQSKSTPHWA